MTRSTGAGGATPRRGRSPASETKPATSSETLAAASDSTERDRLKPDPDEQAQPDGEPASQGGTGQHVELYTDGACSGNPGPGGWAFILRHPKSGANLEKSGGERLTTNNRMELLGVISGLEALKKPTRVDLFTDSVYVGKGLSEWLPGWKRNGWKRREGGQLKPIKNDDLWRRLDALLQIHQVRYHRVAGHSGHPENDRCDQLAVEACRQFR